MRDSPGLVLGQLREPAAVFLHDAVVGKPALIDPGVRPEQETVGVACEDVAPAIRQRRAIGDAAAIRQLAHQAGKPRHQLLDPRRRRRESGVRPDDPRLGIMPEQDQERLLVAMRMQP
jgi:hypothetical protein